MLNGGMLGCWSSLVLTCLLAEPPPIQRPKSMTPPPTEVPTPSEPVAPEPTPPETIEPITPEPVMPEPTAPIVAPQRPRAFGTPPVLPSEPTLAPAPSEHADPVAEVQPPRVADPFSGEPPAPRARSRRVVDPFVDGRPSAPARDGKALLYGGLAFSAIVVAIRVPVSTKLVRVGNPYDAMVYGNIVNVAAAAAVSTLVVGAVRRGRALAYTDVFENRERRFNAKAMTITGWTMFGLGMGAFVLSRVFTPLSCDLVNQCDFRALEATWYLSFGLVAAGAGLGSFGLAYGERARSYEKRVAITPILDRSRAGLGISGKF